MKPNNYRQAIQVMDACNLSGILHSWAHMQTDIRTESKGAYALHPINQLFASKVIEICGMGFAESQQFSKAYESCRLEALRIEQEQRNEIQAYISRSILKEKLNA